MPYLGSILCAVLAISSTTLAAVNGPCTANGVPGICIATAACKSGGGKSASGFCPNDPNDIKCCTKACGSGGTCRFTSSCTGSSQAGLCPGPANFQCCTPKSGGGGGGATGLSSNGVSFIAGFEGFRANFYTDAAGVKTIGYGHACQPASSCNNIKAPITEKEGKDLLAKDAARFVSCVNSEIDVPLTQNQFDALVSFSFNLGCGTLKNIAPNLNAKKFSAATTQMKKYVNAGGVPLAGLIRRRNAEVDLFNKP
ncbi:MAG: hypothetical protein M1837_007024 [Sclerophora amabilis]|nr:MAG: hypothetical protein M1837_007024 [Sclerophora amabilis]